MDDKDFITRREHEEFARRIDQENHRQNNRINTLEDSIRQINDLTVSVKEMSANMKNMLEEQKRQGERLEKLEKEPADNYRQIKMSIVTSVISIVVGAVIGAVIVLL